MLAQNSHAGRVLLELLSTLLIGLAPVACGLLVMAWQVDKKLEESAEVAVRELIHNTDALIDTLHTASSNVLNLAEMPCDEALKPLRKEVVLHPEIRSLVLLRENRAFCSTVHGESELLVAAGNFLNQRLRLEPGNDVTPDSAILYYRLQEYPFGVLALTDGINLQEEMRAIKANVTLGIQVGGAFLFERGNVIDTALPDHSEQHLDRISSKYGYTVHAGYPTGYTWQETVNNALIIAPSVLMVGVFTSAIAYFALYRRRARR